MLGPDLADLQSNVTISKVMKLHVTSRSNGWDVIPEKTAEVCGLIYFVIILVINIALADTEI